MLQFSFINRAISTSSLILPHPALPLPCPANMCVLPSLIPRPICPRRPSCLGGRSRHRRMGLGTRLCLLLAVLGVVPPAELGCVLPHEHVLLDFTDSRVSPAFGCCDADMRDLELTMENLGVIRQFPLVCVCVRERERKRVRGRERRLYSVWHVILCGDAGFAFLVHQCVSLSAPTHTPSPSLSPTLLSPTLCTP